MSDSAAIPSPCTNVCRIDPASGFCEGCLRTLDEIAAWSALPAQMKLVVWDSLANRRSVVGAQALASPDDEHST
jgi:predicted Fe-S protein YdhL (DUF1289 family)